MLANKTENHLYATYHIPVVEPIVEKSELQELSTKERFYGADQIRKRNKIASIHGTGTWWTLIWDDWILLLQFGTQFDIWEIQFHFLFDVSASLFILSSGSKFLLGVFTSSSQSTRHLRKGDLRLDI